MRLKIALGLGMVSVAILFGGASGTAQSRQSPPEIRVLKILPDGKVLATLRFSTDAAQPTPLTALYRFNSDGSPDPNFERPVFDGALLEIVPQTDGKLLIHGLFTTVNGTTRKRIARLNADGSLDVSFIHSPRLFPANCTGLARS